MRLHPDDFGDQEMELVYIAGRLEEAKTIEGIFDQHEIDYAIRVEDYRSGVIFASVRAGAFFYVDQEDAGRSRDALRRLGYRVWEPVG